MLKKLTEKILMRNTWAEINLDAMVNNLNLAKKIIGPKTKIAAVLKANAYGHGAINVAKLMIENNVDMLSVACLSEALELRRCYPEFPIMVIGYTPDELFKIAVENDICLTIFSQEQALELSEHGSSLGKEAVVHIKIDTGLNRIGLKAGEETVGTIIEMYNMKGIKIEGIFTHLALKSSEDDEQQYNLFMDIISELEAEGVHIPIRHICDGNGMMLYPDYHLDMIRLGGLIYGVAPMGTGDNKRFIKQVLTLKTRITQVKEIEKGEGVGYDYRFVAQGKCVVGTLAAGYSDGYMRCLAKNSEVSVRGKRAPIIGIMCMDQMMVDVTHIPEARAGDEVILLGGSEIAVEELAGKADTNRNEIISIIGRRVPRVYIKDSCIIDIVDYLLD